MKTTKLTLLIAACVFLFGCASGAKKENMIYQGEQKTYDKTLNNNVEVTAVTGGKETNAALKSEISSEDFSAALKASLSKQGLLSDQGKYQLQVKLSIVDQDLFGADMTVTTHVQYVLTDIETNSVLLDDVIAAPYTATMGDALLGATRLRMANEGSGRKNIEKLLEKLADLNVNEISLIQ